MEDGFFFFFTFSYLARSTCRGESDFRPNRPPRLPRRTTPSSFPSICGQRRIERRLIHEKKSEEKKLGQARTNYQLCEGRRLNDQHRSVAPLLDHLNRIFVRRFIDERGRSWKKRWWSLFTRSLSSRILFLNPFATSPTKMCSRKIVVLIGEKKNWRQKE